jgi:hypothetical protein
MSVMDEEKRSGQNEATRRPYAPPGLEKVLLRPDEAVLGFCKNNTKAGPTHVNCRAVGQCATQGS